MGRHSAPDDDGDLLVAPPPAADRPLPRPRHAVPDEGADAPVVATDVIEPELVERRAAAPREVVDAVVVEDEAHSVRAEPIAELAAPPVEQASEPGRLVAPAEVAAAPAKPARERPSRADLRLLRESQSLRARCLAAILLPFILYTIVFVVIDRVDAYLLWIWIPTILAGVLFGAQLDGAAKAAARQDGTVREASGESTGESADG